MIERRTERVDPADEQSVIELMASFGWEAVDSQEIYYETTETTGADVTLYGDGLIGGFMRGWTGNDGSIKVHTKTSITNYVTLTFVRDKAMPAYARLKELEEKFFADFRLYVAPKKPVAATVILCIGLAVILYSIINAIVERISPEIWEIVVCVVFPAVMAVVVALSWKRYRKKCVQYAARGEYLTSLIDEANSLHD